MLPAILFFKPEKKEAQYFMIYPSHKVIRKRTHANAQSLIMTGVWSVFTLYDKLKKSESKNNNKIFSSFYNHLENIKKIYLAK